MLAKTIAKTIMMAWPSAPEPDDPWARYANASEAERDQILIASARSRYDYEHDIEFFSKYFPDVDPAEFRGKRLLDLGCFTGGRLVHWVERYGFVNARGIDIDERFERAGYLFAREKGIAADFDTGFAEALPYESDSFDFIATYDVLEHVRSVEQALAECRRVLKPGGRLLCVFPQYLQPLEAHLGCATGWPALHWFFSGKTLAAAYYELVKDTWYARQSPELEPWERLVTLNGISVRAFRRLIRAGWELQHWGTEPILSDGRRARLPIFRVMRHALALPARLPLLEELFLGRICAVLKKEG